MPRPRSAPPLSTTIRVPYRSDSAPHMNAPTPMQRKFSIAAVAIPVRDQPMRGQAQLTEPGERVDLESFLEPEHVPVEWKQVVQVFAPDRRPAQSLDHRYASFRTSSCRHVRRTSR